MKTLRVKITFLEDILGTLPSNDDVYREFIGSKSPDAATIEEEVAALGVDEMVEKGTTVFPRTEAGAPFLYDYQVKGFFKDSCSALSRVAEKDPVTKKKKPCNESSKLTAYKKIIDGLIFVEPRQIVLETDKPISLCQRPLRAQTAQGERVALASSESVAAGAVAVFEVICFSDEHEAAVREWLDYGRWKGIGQWRNSGKGRFTWEEITD